MAKPLPETLADFLLGMQKHPSVRLYAKECLRFWRQHYGEKVAQQVAALIRGKL